MNHGRWIAVTLLISLWPAVAAAGTASESLEALREGLEALIDEGERARSADPRFLGELRALLQGHGSPSSVNLVADDFADGDFNRAPRWQVVSGQFTVAWDGGLLSEARTDAEV